ncbi:hypothetical protein H9L15_00175 [Sphingomonas daechungensis]|uniref:Uncharacterized protein n=1 Tax=Sphingomonas daechungensis TaxID=1176646 RepID=A0ABX6T3R9_9SPHN|nr:hypothetical protein H9L15_00175 [Sphingomonas daechungensis]
MLDAVREAWVRRIAAEVEVGLARVSHRPLADAVVEVEQARLVGDLVARLGRDKAARRGRRDRRLLVARTLADEAARTDRAILHLRRALALRRTRGALGRGSLFRSSIGRGGAGRGAGRSAGAGFGAGAAAAGARCSFSSPGLTGDGRASRPRRWALPMTALRLTPPSSSAIWLAVAPCVHIAFRRSIRSSVQDI